MHLYQFNWFNWKLLTGKLKGIPDPQSATYTKVPDYSVSTAEIQQIFLNKLKIKVNTYI